MPRGIYPRKPKAAKPWSRPSTERPAMFMPRRGERMTKGKGWRLVNVQARNEFVGALLHTIQINGGHRLAIFSVWKS